MVAALPTLTPRPRASTWPEELGGAGFSTREQFIVDQERERAGAPRVGGTGAMFLGSLLMAHGNEERPARYRPPIARGEVEWRRATRSRVRAPTSPR